MENKNRKKTETINFAWGRSNMQKDGERKKEKRIHNTKEEKKKKVIRKTSENKKMSSAQKNKGIQGKGKVPEKEKISGRREISEKKRKTEGRQVLCPYFKKCGGCKYLDLSYDKQLNIKQHMVENLIGKYVRVQPIKGMKEPFHYRNKVHAVFDRDSRGNILSGIYKEGTHKVVSIDSCLLEDEKADEIILTIRGMLKSFKIKTYDEDTGYGLLRHVLVRRGFATGQIMVVLVTASPIFPSKNNFVKALLQVHPEITTVVQNINEKNTSMVLGEQERVMYGRGYIEDVLCGITFRISSRSFYQVNPVQTEYLYKKAMELAGLTGKETVIDAYCGIGTIGMTAAAKAGHVIGVELNKDAVRDAVLNAKNNHVENIDFYCNDAGRFMEQYLAESRRQEMDNSAGNVSNTRMGQKEKRFGVDVVFMDPPRSGSSKEFMDSLAALEPKKIVYISCNPETLARDLEYLGKKGYRVRECCPVDMFCWTEHVETVCLLSKLHSDQHIEVELQMDELDLTAAESKATYEEIKEYVLEHSGLKVSSLYIAQVKQKCGIIERINYNPPKSENSRQPKCPPEKEKAIREALEYFRMI